MRGRRSAGGPRRRAARVGARRRRRKPVRVPAASSARMSVRATCRRG